MPTARTVSATLAFGAALVGIGLFSVMDAFMKSLVLAIGVYNAMLWRTGVAALLGAGVWAAGSRSRPSARAVRLHFVRGAITTVMSLLFFWGLARVPMAQGIAMTYVAPLLALLLAAALLGERVGRGVVLASLAALGGVLVILAGQAGGGHGSGSIAGAVAILTSAALYALNLVVARAQSQAAGPAEIALFQSGIVVTLLMLAAPWLAVMPPAVEWPKLVAAALLATGSLLLLAFAYAHGETGYLATTEYSSFVYASVLGWLVFGERVATPTLVGAAIIIAACLHAARTRPVAGGALEGAA